MFASTLDQERCTKQGNPTPMARTALVLLDIWSIWRQSKTLSSNSGLKLQRRAGIGKSPRLRLFFISPQYCILECLREMIRMQNR